MAGRRGRGCRGGKYSSELSVSCRRSGFHPSLDFPDWMRPSSPREQPGAGASEGAVAVATQQKGTEAGSTQGRCCATGTHSPRALPLGRRSGCGAHTWTPLRSPLLPAPGSLRLGSLGRTDPGEEALGKSSWRQSISNLSAYGVCLIVLYFFFFFFLNRRSLLPAQLWEVAKSEGVGPVAAPSGPCLAGRGAAPKHGWPQEKKGRRLRRGQAPYA